MDMDMSLSLENPIKIINTNTDDIVFYKKINENINSDKTVFSICMGGLGDYLRCSIVLAHYAKYFGIYFKMCMDTHPISNYLTEVQSIHHPYEIIPVHVLTNVTNDQHDTLYSQFIQFMESPEKNMYINSNLCYNMRLPTRDIRNEINSNLSFKPEYYDTANQLIGLDSYEVLHIRVGDEYFNLDINPDNEKVNNLFNEITKLNLPTNTIVMSNNYNIKKKNK